ncbi:MAG: hypothetical protein HYR76_07590 [Ignavibacteria bacterium]|nr:hypothetical protein [Ignavibacteria bacterium]MBI3765607.1 hypothetical protein [Ignavibacteriales bacterium]
MATLRTGLLICIGVLFLTCRDNTIEIIDNTPPGRRDYTWTVDTLKANPGDQIYLFSLWGSSPTDVWAVGHADASDLSKWHYDGIRWTRDSSRLSSNLQSVYGFAPNNIWACDAPGGNIWHYDGSQWSLFGHYTPPGFYSLAFNNIWGDAPNNIYAVGGADSLVGNGYRGMIMHYDGATWQFVSISDIRVGFGWIRRGINESYKYYLSATRFEASGDTEKIYEFDGTGLKEIYRTTTEVTTVNDINGRIYFAIGKKVLKYQNNHFQLWQDFTGTTFIGRLWGRSEKDFFSVASDGIGHFNGADFKTLYTTDAIIFNAQIFEKEVFFVCLSRQTSFPIVIHGVLK